jgi:hypothetical protein
MDRTGTGPDSDDPIAEAEAVLAYLAAVEEIRSRMRSLLDDLRQLKASSGSVTSESIHVHDEIAELLVDFADEVLLASGNATSRQVYDSLTEAIDVLILVTQRDLTGLVSLFEGVREGAPACDRPMHHKSAVVRAITGSPVDAPGEVAP